MRILDEVFASAVVTSGGMPTRFYDKDYYTTPDYHRLKTPTPVKKEDPSLRPRRMKVGYQPYGQGWRRRDLKMKARHG